MSPQNPYAEIGRRWRRPMTTMTPLTTECLRRQIVAQTYKDTPWVEIRNGELVGELPPRTPEPERWAAWERKKKREYQAKRQAEAAKVSKKDSHAQLNTDGEEDSKMVDSDPLASIPDRDPPEQSNAAWTDFVAEEKGTYDPLSQIQHANILMQDVPMESSSKDEQQQASKNPDRPKFTDQFNNNATIEHIVIPPTVSSADLLKSYSQLDLPDKVIPAGTTRQTRPSRRRQKLLCGAECREYHIMRREAISQPVREPQVSSTPAIEEDGGDEEERGREEEGGGEEEEGGGEEEEGGGEEEEPSDSLPTVEEIVERFRPRHPAAKKNGRKVRGKWRWYAEENLRVVLEDHENPTTPLNLAKKEQPWNVIKLGSQGLDNMVRTGGEAPMGHRKDSGRDIVGL